MSEVLSQSEIDELFKALNSGEVDIDDIQDSKKEKVIKAYDFTRPSKFSKEQLRTLEVIYENYARNISTFLSGHLRIMANVEVMSAEALTYREFSNSLSNPLLLGVIDFSPLKGSVLLEMAPTLGFAIIDKVLGGKGETLEKMRDFTDIERIVLIKIFKHFTELLIEPWKNVINISPKMENLETNPQIVQIISPSETVALITLSVEIGTVKGLINMCLPHLTLEPIMDRLNTKYWFTQPTQATETANVQDLNKKLEGSVVPVKVVLGQTHISVSDFLNLEINDVLRLDKAIDGELDVYVGGLHKFTASPGTSNSKAAIRINSIMTEEEY